MSMRKALLLPRDVPKTLDGLALAQSNVNEQTDAEVENLAARIIASHRYAEATQTPTGSVACT